MRALRSGGSVVNIEEESVSAARPSIRVKMEWLALAAVPSSLLMGVTTYIATDLVSIPLVWVVPLALYLLSSSLSSPAVVDPARDGIAAQPLCSSSWSCLYGGSEVAGPSASRRVFRDRDDLSWRARRSPAGR